VTLPSVSRVKRNIKSAIAPSAAAATMTDGRSWTRRRWPCSVRPVSAPLAGMRGVVRPVAGSLTGGGAPSAAARQARMFSFSDVMFGCRSPGLRASARFTRFCTSRGRLGRTCPIGLGSSFAFRWRTSMASSPTHGARPVSIS
jgi:hypothetical protein